MPTIVDVGRAPDIEVSPWPEQENALQIREAAPGGIDTEGTQDWIKEQTDRGTIVLCVYADGKRTLRGPEWRLREQIRIANKVAWNDRAAQIRRVLAGTLTTADIEYYTAELAKAENKTGDEDAEE